MLHSIKKSLSIPLALIICVTIFTACEDDDDGPGPTPEMNIAETVEAESNLSTLEDYIAEYELTDTLSSDGPFAVFAPSDDAFSEADLEGLSDEEVELLLQYHVVPVGLSYEDLLETESVETMSGDTLFFSSENDTLTINDSYQITSDAAVGATNGTIFQVDTVLTAPGSNE